MVKKMKCDTGELFISMLYKKLFIKGSKNIFKIIHYKRSLKRFKCSILKGSPDFYMLCEMSEFIRQAKKYFFYGMEDVKDINIYQSDKYIKGENGFVLTFDKYRIAIKLYEGNLRTSIEVSFDDAMSVTGQPVAACTTLKFKNSQWVDSPTKQNELLLEQVIKDINRKIIELFDFCYEKI